MSAVRGACYGFAVRSPLPLAYLRRAGGEPTLSVAAPAERTPPGGAETLIEWPAAPPRPGSRLRGDGRRYWFNVDGDGWFRTDPEEPRIDPPPFASPIDLEERLWAFPALLCFLRRGDLPLHAAAVEVGGGALVLTGHSTAGKTTLAAAFARAGHRVLSEDLTCYRPGPEPAVVPGPAMLRLRPDMAAALEVPGARVLREDPGRTHLALTGDAGDGRPVPLRGVVVVGPPAPEIALEPLPPTEVVRHLWSLNFGLPSDADRARAFVGQVDLARQVPAWTLHRPLSLEALEPTVAALEAAVGAAVPAGV